ncbi:MAG: Sbal_3080 family lipoprotein [Halopseudomonas sp.]|uniref:Sbal_3080 family lipoprotein n=1 Tax=Halopseudomonas sp. TaxID=2901191 RepID=UPI003001CE84
MPSFERIAARIVQTLWPQAASRKPQQKQKQKVIFLNISENEALGYPAMGAGPEKGRAMKNGLLCLPLLIAGCTSVTVEPVDPADGIVYVCIQDNAKVMVSDFLPVVQAGFERHGIATQVFSGALPQKCEYVLSYTALRSWDMAPYLSHAELWLDRRGQRVASAEYHLNGKGGLSLMKWQGTQAKMDPVIDQLLGGAR